jgi:hypothetical protein
MAGAKFRPLVKTLLLFLGIGTALSAGLSGCDLSPDSDTRWRKNQSQIKCDCYPSMLPTIYQDEAAATPYPEATAAIFAFNILWTANASGLLTGWDIETGDYEQYRLPDNGIVTSLTANDHSLYIGASSASLWKLSPPSATPTQIAQASGWISAIALDETGNIWYADASCTTANKGQKSGEGLIRLTPDGQRTTHSYPLAKDTDSDPSRHITDIAVDDSDGAIWASTACCGILCHHPEDNTWEHYLPVSKSKENAAVFDLETGSDGSIWAATSSGLLHFQEEHWDLVSPLGTEEHPHAVRTIISNGYWIVGDTFISHETGEAEMRVYPVADNPTMRDRMSIPVPAPGNQVWFVGARGRLHYNDDDWTVYDADARRFATFEPVALRPVPLIPPDFPSPREDYTAWLRAWPRPAADNGLGLHFLQSHQFDEIEAQRQVNRLQRLGIKWTLVTYRDTHHLRQIAPIFQAAGIAVIWRPFVRPYQEYPYWEDDVSYLRSRGIAPYIQLYNEPSLEQEWDNYSSSDQELFLRNLLEASRRVHKSGGYVGLQFVNTEWLKAALREIKTSGDSGLLDRVFFIPHLYGLNHPPDYTEDINSLLGFREYAALFQSELGYIPPMVVGEGGWRPGEAQDDRFPAVSEDLHRDYHVAAFEVFRTGTLPDGQPLPDYLFAFCPWLLSDTNDPAAWFDSSSGNRTQTITAVEEMPPFVRRFSWEKEAETP